MLKWSKEKRGCLRCCETCSLEVDWITEGCCIAAACFARDAKGQKWKGKSKRIPLPYTFCKCPLRFWVLLTANTQTAPPPHLSGEKSTDKTVSNCKKYLNAIVKNCQWVAYTMVGQIWIGTFTHCMTPELLRWRYFPRGTMCTEIKTAVWHHNYFPSGKYDVKQKSGSWERRRPEDQRDKKCSVLASAPLHTQDTEIGLGALVWQPQPSFSISDRSRQDKALL